MSNEPNEQLVKMKKMIGGKLLMIESELGEETLKK